MERTLTSVEEALILQIEEYERQIDILKQKMKHHKLLITVSIITVLWALFSLPWYLSWSQVGGELVLFIFVQFWLLVILFLVAIPQLAHKHEIQDLKRYEQNILDKLAIFKVKYDPETKKVEFMD